MTSATPQQLSRELVELLNARYGSLVASVAADQLGDVVARVERSSLLEFMRALKGDPQLQFSMMVDITAVDWMDSAPQRFEVVYHLLSLAKRYRLRLKVWAPENDAVVPSVVSLWAGANYMERETWDMYGVKFEGNADLRRLLTYDEFIGHPLRKDYPVEGKQPRIPLRHPEVRNTAVDMQRPALVQINRQSNRDSAAASTSERRGS